MPRPLRVLVLTVAHPPQDARIHNRQVRSLLARGHQVTYVAPFSAFGVPPLEGVACVDVPRSVGRHRVGPVLAALRRARRLAPGHDVVIGHDPELLPVLHHLRSWNRDLQVVWDVHEDVPAQMEMTPWIPRPVEAPAAALARLAERASESRLHLTLAEFAYQERFRRRHPVVPNSPRVPAQLPPEPPRAPGEPWRVVYLGALTAARGVEEMLALAQRLPEDVVLELIGNASPALDARLRALRDPRLDYRGFVPNEEALRRLPGALAGLVLLHRHDNYRHSQFTKIMEYMAHGVPTVTTANPAAVELVRGAQAGVVVDFGDVDAVLRALVELRDDPGRRERMRRSGHAAAVAEHNWCVDGERFVDQLEEWVAQGRRARS